MCIYIVRHNHKWGYTIYIAICLHNLRAFCMQVFRVCVPFSVLWNRPNRKLNVDIIDLVDSVKVQLNAKKSTANFIGVVL